MKSRILFDEKGYALPSVLFLITILSVIAGSIIVQQYLSIQLVERDVAAVKAEFAAESGIARVLSTCVSARDLGTMVAGFEGSYEFEDGAKALVSTQPWGMFLLVQARGISGKTSVVRWALAANRPTGYFKNALFFANPQHQLVFAGTSHIRGDVVVGFPGASTGRLRNLPTPAALPVQGSISRQGTFQLNASQAPQLGLLQNKHHDLLSVGRSGKQEPPGSMFLDSGQENGLRTTDSAGYVFIRGNCHIVVPLERYQSPLRIVVDGSVLVKSTAELKGLVSIHASSSITVESGAVVDGAVLVSSTMVEILSGVRISAQCIAPAIRIAERVQCTYPSVILSTEIAPGVATELSMAANTRIEGTVAMIAGGRTSSPPSIAPSAKVVGCLYSDTPMTFDGIVVGSVVARDFEFYDPPTRYVGWLRTARIDRRSLPVSFLLPPGFSNTVELDILDWL